MLFGVHNDEALTRKISEVELLIFRQRTLGEPMHDYIPLIDLFEKFLTATKGPLNPVYKAIGIADKIETFDKAEKNAKALRDLEAGYCKNLTHELHDRIEQGDATPSQLGDLIRVYGMQITPADEFRVATSLVGSGMGIGTLLTWMGAKLAIHPEMQEKAFAAIKEVYGGDAPDPYDVDRVEYIKALGLEAGRFFASGRLGFSRETVAEAEFAGAKIPAGTLVMQNTYWINRDPERYDQPMEFVPERWMDGHYGRLDGKAVKMGVPHLNHGAGRRFCVGIPCTSIILSRP
jgi:cytochrome P450